MVTKRSHILKQTCKWKLQVCLSMCDLFVALKKLKNDSRSNKNQEMLKFLKSPLRMLAKCTYKSSGRFPVGVGFIFQLSDRVKSRYLQFLSFNLLNMHIYCTFFTSHNPFVPRRSYFYENYTQHSHFLTYTQNIALLVYKWICFHIFIVNLKWIKYIIHSVGRRCILLISGG